MSRDLAVRRRWGLRERTMPQVQATPNPSKALERALEAAVEARENANAATLRAEADTSRLRAGISWVRGMCTDECSHVEIDKALSALLDGREIKTLGLPTTVIEQAHDAFDTEYRRLWPSGGDQQDHDEAVRAGLECALYVAQMHWTEPST